MSTATVPAEPVLLDVRGIRRAPAITPGFRAGQPPVTKGRRYPPDPLSVEDIVRLLEACSGPRAARRDELCAARTRALIVLLWRSGLRISEACALETRDLNRRDLAITVRRGKGGKRRIAAMDEWAWHELDRWLDLRADLPDTAVFCVVDGPTAGRPLNPADARNHLRAAGRRAGLKRRCNPHALRHTLAVELWREGVDVYAIQQQLGHARLDVTAQYLRGVAPVELLEPIGRRRPPVMPIPTAGGRS